LLAVSIYTPAWSSDGKYLAFVGAIDGPSSDLYIYNVESGEIIRLTDGPFQAGMLNWSPDDEWIVHEAVYEVNSRRPGQRETVNVWAASVDGTEVKKLYEFPAEAGSGTYQRFLGWISDSQFVVSFQNPYSPDTNYAKIVDVSNGELVDIEFEGYSDCALDPVSQVMAFAFDIDDLGVVSYAPGLYTSSLTSEDDLKYVETETHYVVWSREIQKFIVEQGFVSLDGVFENPFDLDNLESIVYPDDPINPYPSPDGQWVAFRGDLEGRIFSIDGEVFQEISIPTGYVSYPWDIIWTPSSTSFFFKGDSYTAGPHYDFYYVDAVGSDPVLIANDLYPVRVSEQPDAVWVFP
jgi:hypothetical protein